MIFFAAVVKADSNNLLPALKKYIEKAANEFGDIPDERKTQLEEISNYLQQKLDKNERIEMIFICTHNSRRSHMAQLWAAAAADYYGINNFETFSGGTEATAFNPRAVKALQKAGFRITVEVEAPNTVYKTVFDENKTPLKSFSKRYYHEENPQKDFAAVMVCSDADETCPVVSGAESRFSLPYEDPKKYDGTDQEEEKYDERCAQIAREITYIFSRIK